MATVANSLWNPWCNDRATLALYRRRCQEQAEEMTCAAQAAEILSERVSTGETLLDAGCGGGYYLHSLRRRQVDVAYHGLDYTPEMIEMAREEICSRAGLAHDRFILGAIEDLDHAFDTVICFNVLTNSPHYALPLERLLLSSRRRILLRESLAEQLMIRFTPDPFLDEGKKHIRVYHNNYPIEEVIDFMEAGGFRVTRIRDRRTGDQPEDVIGIPHHWRILLGERR